MFWKSTLFLFAILLFLSSSCKDDGSDQLELKNPDLLFEYANIQNTIVMSGETQQLNSSITNAAVIDPDCETKKADPTDRSTELEYRPDTSSIWSAAQLKNQNGDLVYIILKNTPELNSNESFNSPQFYSFLTPGFYRYRLGADYEEVVVERDESNNGASSNEGTIRSPSAQISQFNLSFQVIDTSGTIRPNYNPDIPVIAKYLGE